MKKLLITIGLLGTLSINAQVPGGVETNIVIATSVNISTTNRVVNVIDGIGYWKQLLVYNPGPYSVQLKFHDGVSTNATRGPVQGYTLISTTNDATITYAGYVTNGTRSVVTFAGPTNSISYTGWYTYSVTNAAAAGVAYPIRYDAVIPPAQSIYLATPTDPPVWFTRGVNLTLTNGTVTNLVITGTYVK